MKRILIILTIFLLTTCNKPLQVRNPNDVVPWISQNITYETAVVDPIVYSQKPRAVLRRKTANCVGYVSLAMFLLKQLNEESFFIILDQTHAVLYWRNNFYEVEKNVIILNPHNITDILTLKQVLRRFY